MQSTYLASVSLAALPIGVIGLPSGVQAQAANVDQATRLEEVIVTGFAASTATSFRPRERSR